jgi:hypothetical protein
MISSADEKLFIRIVAPSHSLHTFFLLVQQIKRQLSRNDEHTLFAQRQ